MQLTEKMLLKHKLWWWLYTE